MNFVMRVFWNITLCMLVLFVEFTYAVPSGFDPLDSENGIQVYRKEYSGGYPDYVQVIDLSTGAKLKLLHGSITNHREGEGVYGGNNPLFTRQSQQTIWSDFQSSVSQAFSMINGQFFNDIDNGYIVDPTSLAFPIKVDGQVVSDGYGITEYPNDKLILELFNAGAKISELTQESLYNSSAPNIIAGLTTDSCNKGCGFHGITFLGVGGGANSDGTYKKIYIFSSKFSTEEKARSTLESFGAAETIMLDGGASSMLTIKGTKYVSTYRTIPQAIGILSANNNGSSINLTVYDFWKKADPIYADSSSDIWHPNFDAQYKIRNDGSESITIQKLALSIHYSDNSFWFDMSNPTTGQPRYYDNLVLYPGESHHFDFAVAYFTAPGNYKVVVKAQIAGEWNELDSTDFVVQPPVCPDSATLTNGDGDGSVTITVDPYGTFGTATAAGAAMYDPIGSYGSASTVYQSSLYIGMLDSGNSAGGLFLYNADNEQYFPGDSVSGGMLTSISSKEAKSTFSVKGLDCELTQTLNDKGPQGSTLTQTYKFTNTTGSDQSFDLIRHVDGDLYFEGNFLNDYGGASSDGKTLFEFDSGDDPTNPSTFVGITNEGGDDLGFHIGYRIESYMFTDDIVSQGAAVLDNSITGDTNGDRIIDNPYDVTLTLGNRFLTIVHGQTVTFATKTIFGAGSPIARAALPTGVVPVQEHNNTINPGETHWYDFINDAVQDIWVVLGFGSEFNLRIYQPDGTLSQEEQTETSPIVMFIPNAQIGIWQIEVSDIDSIQNDPYMLAVGVRDAEADTDTTSPVVTINVPNSGDALQDDGITLIATATDACGVDEVYFCIREPDPDETNGISIGYEDLVATLNESTGMWEYSFDTTQLQDGYYVILAKAVDTNGNEGWSTPVPVSIRNWAVIELLPNTANNKAGRTMPVKFALRIAPAVDPAQPFVYNEELEIRIYDKSEPGTILQTSLYGGDASTDYRIDTAGELYITNFKTMKQPATYVVEIWRMSKNFLVGRFTFETVK